MNRFLVVATALVVLLTAYAGGGVLLMLAATYLLLNVSLAFPRTPRHRPAAYRAGHVVGAGVLRGAPAPTPDSSLPYLRRVAAAVE